MKKIGLTLLLTATMTFATMVSFNGAPVTLNSNGLKVGDSAPAFNATTIEFTDTVVGGKKNKVQVIAFVPSLDTRTCRIETIEFNKKIANMSNVLLTIVSKDLPFTQQRFCRDNSITNIETVSDYKDANNALRYGTTISAPAFLEGFFGRVIYIVDTKGKIAYVQVVKEIADQPNYDQVVRALKNIR
ncbi:thiol peroxidase [Sulfurimonas sp.]